MFRRAVFLLLCAALTGVANAQNYRGNAVPTVERRDPVEFSRLRFLTFAFGREGPMDAPLPTRPVSGREYFVEADIFGIESAASVRFELVDASGRMLQTFTAWKTSDGLTDGEFYGLVTVPNQPFRAAVSGVERGGAAFRSVSDTLIQPLPNGPPEQWIIPSSATPNERAQLESMVAAYRQELRTRAAQAAAAQPGGVITLPGPVVSRISYEPFTSTSGAPIGVRLRYTVEFKARQTITAVPHVFPVYQSTAWRGMVAMKPLGGAITPAPEMVGVQSLRDVIVYQAAATYQAGVTYTFTIDMAPDYVLQGTQTGRFCIYEQKFNNQPLWKDLIGSQTAVPYSVTLSDLDTYANIPVFFPQRTFYESFIAGGAFDCGPTPNIRF